jgi:uncharacterized protein with NRDE domain
LAALTNYRTSEPQRLDAPSRGALVADFLQGSMAGEAYLGALAASVHHYNPFNLLVFDGQQLVGLESRGARIIHMAAGIGAVSNADFHTPWPKVRRLSGGLQTASPLMPLLHDRALAPDHDLPNTGVALDLERALSAVFIATPAYGTRACSVVKVGRNTIEFAEESWGPDGLSGTQMERFSW